MVSQPVSPELRQILTMHVITSTILLDIDTAARARLRAHTLDCRLGLLVLCIPILVAAAGRVPGPVAGKAEFVCAVWAFGLLFGLSLTTAVFDGEVATASGIQTGDEALTRSEVVLNEGFVPALSKR